MKYLCAVLCIGLLSANANAKSCKTSLDCGMYECCKHLGLINQCLELRDEGETCNGKFLCGCKLGSLCVEREKSVWNTFKVGAGICSALANINWDN
uniref:Prokineticin domain-containing protein n=1 Tax=Strigamia maritima TaxID=126957 RepID=T1JBT4_STRMM